MKIPKLSRHKTGQARVRIKGKDHYLGTYGSPEAEQRYRQLIARLVSGQTAAEPATDHATVRDVVASYLLHVAATLGPESREPAQYSATVKPLLAMFGTEHARDFSPKKLKLLQSEMVRLDWCRNQVNRRTNRVRTIFRWAESEELIPSGITNALATVRPIPKTFPGVRNTASVKPSSREDLDKVLTVLREQSPNAATMLELQWLAGMRSCEVRTMRLADIDRTADVWLYRPTKGKMDHVDGHAPRIVALGPQCQQILAPILSRVKPDAYLFPSRRADCYRADGYAQVVRKAAAKAGVRLTGYAGRHAHKARVTRAMGLDAARAALGQSSLGTTNGYAHQQDVETAIDVARRLA